MILIQASKQATYQMDAQLMLVVFKKYLKDITFNKSETYRIEGCERTYSFKNRTNKLRMGTDLQY